MGFYNCIELWNRCLVSGHKNIRYHQHSNGYCPVRARTCLWATKKIFSAFLRMNSNSYQKILNFQI